MGAFTQGLQEGDFFYSLLKKLPTNFETLLAQAEKYINMEEAQRAHQESRGFQAGELPERRVEPMMPTRSISVRHLTYIPPL